MLEPTLGPANAGTNPQSNAILAQNKVVDGKKFFDDAIRKPLGRKPGKEAQRSRGTERIGALTEPESEFNATDRFPASAFTPESERSAICRFTRSIKNTNFLLS